MWARDLWPRKWSFSILERIDVGETPTNAYAAGNMAALSVSSNGSTWVKRSRTLLAQEPVQDLSVSSNGSTWVKRSGTPAQREAKFSLSVSSNGSTWVKRNAYSQG